MTYNLQAKTHDLAIKSSNDNKMLNNNFIIKDDKNSLNVKSSDIAINGSNGESKSNSKRLILKFWKLFCGKLITKKSTKTNFTLLLNEICEQQLSLENILYISYQVYLMKNILVSLPNILTDFQNYNNEFFDLLKIDGYPVFSLEKSDDAFKFLDKYLNFSMSYKTWKS